MNKVVIACAGSRKTTSLVEEALNDPSKRILITTYTVNNVMQIREMIIRKVGFIPKNIKVQTWFSFLLSDGVRPYQSYMYQDHRIKNIHFVSSKSAMYVKKTDIKKYYISGGEYIYTDKITDFIIQCNSRSSGLVINRLEEQYDYIFIDEVQDMAGYDLDFIELIIKSRIGIMIVGDCRQATYFTNCSIKNKQYKGCCIDSLFQEWEKQGLVEIEERNINYRSNQMICDFSDRLYPEYTASRSSEVSSNEHEGIIRIPQTEVERYILQWNPTILRYSRSTKTPDTLVFNYGETKGLTFDRVLIYPTKTILDYLNSGTELEPLTRSKFYVAITRARHSVAIVV